MAYLRSVLMPLLFQLQFTAFSAFWLIFSLVLGLAYAFLLYSKSSHLNKSLIRLLFIFRALGVALIAFLLLAPLIQTSSKTLEKPILFLLQDNSASINISKPANFNNQEYNRGISTLIKELANDYELKTLTFGNKIQTSSIPNLKDKSTDISAAFKYIQERYRNTNIGAIILASDGIYNRGSNPQYESQNIKAPIYTIALGDTIPKKDVLVSNVNYNSIVYLGNEFQVEIALEAFQSKGNSCRLTVTDKSGTIISKPVFITSNEFRSSISLNLSAKQKGIQKYTVSLSPVSGELSKENNTQTFFVEVVDGRQKVFILANSPHPDITALKQSIEINKNYEVKAGFPGSYNKEDVQKADLLILHQLPSITLSNQVLSSFIQKKNVWYILGAQSATSAFSSLQNVLNLNATGSTQEATAKVSPDFYEFILSEPTKTKLGNFAPLLTPFGNYGFKSQTSVLLNQQIGKLVTDRPLLLFSKDAEQKMAVLTGEGIWRWRLEDFKENNNHQAVDELVTKVVQYLSSKEDKRKFRVYASKNSFDENEHIILNGELYNDAYELINTPDASITLKNGKNKSYPFVFSKTGNSYILDAGILPAGEYSFHAKTQLGKTRYTAGGQLVITQQLAEFKQTTANHQLLHNLSKQSGGEFIQPNQISSLAKRIKQNELIKTITYENKKFDELIHIKWLFFIILGLFSIEWFTRKRHGES